MVERREVAVAKSIRVRKFRNADSWRRRSTFSVSVENESSLVDRPTTCVCVCASFCCFSRRRTQCRVARSRRSSSLMARLLQLSPVSCAAHAPRYTGICCQSGHERSSILPLPCWSDPGTCDLLRRRRMRTLSCAHAVRNSRRIRVRRLPATGGQTISSTEVFSHGGTSSRVDFVALPVAH